MSEANKALVRRFYDEAFNKGNIAVLDELCAANFTDHNAAPGQAPGLEGVKRMITMYRIAFPDGQITVDDIIVEGDKVAVRSTMRGTHRGEFMGIAPTGKQVSVGGIDIVRVANGKAVEVWHMEDNLGMMQQLGAVPS